jgi:hypothetical protein
MVSVGQKWIGCGNPTLNKKPGCKNYRFLQAMYKVQCGGVCKLRNFERKEKDLNGFLNLESLNGSPKDSETDLK